MFPCQNTFFFASTFAQHLCSASLFFKSVGHLGWGRRSRLDPRIRPFLGKGAGAGSVVLSNGKAPGSLFSARVPAPALR